MRRTRSSERCALLIGIAFSLTPAGANASTVDEPVDAATKNQQGLGDSPPAQGPSDTTFTPDHKEVLRCERHIWNPEGR